MILYRSKWWSRVLCIPLAVLAVTARADVPPVATLFISDTIASDSAAAQAARRWAASLPEDTRLKTQPLNVFNQSTIPKSGIVLAPLAQWSREIPSLDVLRLPFFYRDLTSVHRAIDGELGHKLALTSLTSGWKVLAFWDAGMTAFSGNQRYNRLPNLAGMQFALWEHDPLQETELRALDVWSRVVGERGMQRMAQECLVSSRSTTPAQMWREHLQRIHLDVTLTQDRFEGYMLAIPDTEWNRVSAHQRRNLTANLEDITRWERTHAAKQHEALARLRHAGMTIHRLTAKQREVFTIRMPAWPHFLPQLDRRTTDELLVAAGLATTAGSDHRRRKKTTAYSLPGSQAAE